MLLYRVSSLIPLIAAWLLATAEFIIRAETGEKRDGRQTHTRLAQFTGRDVSYYGDIWEPLPNGRGKLAQPGSRITLNEADSSKPGRLDLSTIDKFAGYLHRGWNDFKVIAVGNRIQTFINGRSLADLTDLTAGAKLKGSVGFCLSQPGVVAQFKEVRLTVVPTVPGSKR